METLFVIVLAAIVIGVGLIAVRDWMSRGRRRYATGDGATFVDYGGGPGDSGDCGSGDAGGGDGGCGGDGGGGGGD